MRSGTEATNSASSTRATHRAGVSSSSRTARTRTFASRTAHTTLDLPRPLLASLANELAAVGCVVGQDELGAQFLEALGDPPAPLCLLDGDPERLDDLGLQRPAVLLSPPL